MRTEGLGAAARLTARDPRVARGFREALARASNGTRTRRGAGAGKELIRAPRHPGPDAPRSTWRHGWNEESCAATLAPVQEPPGPPAARVVDAPIDPFPVTPAALERIAVIARVQRLQTTVELSLGAELSVLVSRGAAGVDVVIDANAALTRWAEAELPRLVASLRARGVRVARAVVRCTRGATGAALTAPRGSATTAPSSPAGGTVAKW